MQTQDMKTAWKARANHSSYEHALYILTWAAATEASPERTLERLKRSFSPIVRPSKLRGNNYQPYQTLQALLYQISQQSKHTLLGKECSEELSLKIRNLANWANRQLQIEARMAKLEVKVAA